jgi:transcriptional regulator with XRE-family HTH domain
MLNELDICSSLMALRVWLNTADASSGMCSSGIGITAHYVLDISGKVLIITSMGRTFGQHLAESRKRASLSLRAVEAKTGISNAYLSQLENGKVQEPSPNILNKLAQLYRIDYLDVLKLAGYPLPSQSRSSLQARLGPTTADEEEALADYLDFLRSKRQGRLVR